MLLFAERVLSWNAAYMTLLTQTNNSAMQRAAQKAGYFVLKGPHVGQFFFSIVFIKPLSPLLLDEDELAAIEAKNTVGEGGGRRREREIDPFALETF